VREAGLAQLHGLLVRVAVRELRRRDAGAWILGRELDDLAHQAADDAMLAILWQTRQFSRPEPVHHVGVSVPGGLRRPP
jgi:hypothetical protein